jgi:hypothetical protein
VVNARLVVGLALAGLVVVGAACQPVASPPPPPPQPVAQYCAPSVPTTPSDYQAAFDGLRNTYTEWASADGAIPVPLPDGRTVWLFGDTYIGTVDGGGAIDPGDPLIRNSFVVQSGNCFAPMMGGGPHARASLIPSAAAGQWSWPASGFVDNNGSVLRVMVWNLQSGGALGFQATGMQVASFALPSMQFLGVHDLPFPTDANHPYGATAMVSGGNAYLYGDNSRNTFVARAPLGQFFDAAAWTFFTGYDASQQPIWGSQANAQATQWNNMPYVNPAFGPGTGPDAQPWVQPYGSGFLATAKLVDVFSSDVSVYSAPTPAGPWTYAGPIATAGPHDGIDVYGAYTLSANASNPIVAYSSNVTSLFGPPSPLTISTYGPHFVAPSSPLPGFHPA